MSKKMNMKNINNVIRTWVGKSIAFLGMAGIFIIRSGITFHKKVGNFVAARYKKISTKEIVSMGGIVLTLITVWALHNQLSSQASNARKQISAEQFKNAIEHLGSEKPTIVLGGVHALHNLAVSFPEEYSQAVFEVLCSFIREETANPEYKKKFPSTTDAADEKPAILPSNQATSPIVIQTVIDKLFRDEKFEGYREYKANLSGAFLRGMDFSKASLQKANLANAYLQRVNLSSANLQEANLHTANMQRVNLISANLQEANLHAANLQGAFLSEANFSRADLSDAKLETDFSHNVNFQGANFNAVDLQKIFFYNTNFQGANLWSVKLRRSRIRGVNFRGVQDHILWRWPRDFVRDAIKNGTGLKTNLSGITLYDDEGKELKLDDEEKKKLFRANGANVDDLSAAEVQEIFGKIEANKK